VCIRKEYEMNFFSKIAPVAFIILFMLSLYPACNPAIHVPGDYPSIQEAIDAAVEGALVLVAPGTYVENIDFLGKMITLRGALGPDVTVIDGDQSGSVVRFALSETEEAVIEGFTIRNGWPSSEGGGIFCYRSSPTIKNCRITENSTYSGGGGIGCVNHASPTITNCTIINNIGGAGGGLYSDYSSPTITNCTFLGNGAGCGGGGAIRSDESSTTITSSILWKNESVIWSEIFVESGSLLITYSDIEGGWTGTGNIDADPLFTGEDDFHLGTGSPCIDAGDPDPSYDDLCFPPSMGTEHNDMGAYGGPMACWWASPDFSPGVYCGAPSIRKYSVNRTSPSSTYCQVRLRQAQPDFLVFAAPGAPRYGPW